MRCPSLITMIAMLSSDERMAQARRRMLGCRLHQPRAGRRHRDRSVHLEHAERPQGLDHAGGGRAALRGPSDQHRPGRPVQARVPGDQPQQQDPGHRRPRQRLPDVRIRRDPDLSRRQDRPAAAAAGRPPRAHGRDAVADVPDGRRRPVLRPDPPLQPLRQGEDPLRDRALRHRDQAPLRGDGPAPGRGRPSRGRGLLDRRRRDLALGVALRVARPRPTASTTSRTSSAGTSAIAARPAVQRGYDVPKAGNEIPRA